MKQKVLNRNNDLHVKIPLSVIPAALQFCLLLGIFCYVAGKSKGRSAP